MIDRSKLYRRSPNENGKCKESFLLYYTTCDAARTAFKGDLTLLGKWFNALLDYEMYGTRPSLDENDPHDILVGSMFDVAASNLDGNYAEWVKRCEINSGNRKSDGKGKVP